MGGVRRVVLGHAHPDHRGGAGGIGAPVLCHPAEVADVEGDGGVHYFDYSKLEGVGRIQMPILMRLADGGPVKVAGTVAEGDEVAGFRVIDLPGHGPGQIGLWRTADRLALSSDCFYTLGSVPPGSPYLPKLAYTFDAEGARASVRKLAALQPGVAWPGHAEPVTGDVRAKLEAAARVGWKLDPFEHAIDQDGQPSASEHGVDHRQRESG
jgi:glyoxylase-like metal-dependent hydrolase (beta-lactamase superfamily II)